MKKLIKNTGLKDIRPLFNHEVENIARYSQFKSLFCENNAYLIFAEPIIVNTPNGQTIDWFTDFDGDLRSFTSLDEETRKYALGVLKLEINYLFKIALYFSESDKNYKNLISVIENSIEIPSFDDLYIVVNNQNKTKIVLTRWGFIGIAFNAPTGLIKSLIPIKIKDVVFRTVNKNGAKIDTVNVNLSFLGKSNIFSSGNQAEIQLFDLPFFARIEANQVLNSGEQTEIQSFIINSKDIYDIIVEGQVKYHDMKFTTIDKNGKISPNETVIFLIDGIEKEFVSDSNGNIKFDKIEEGKTFETYQKSIKNGSKINISKFECDGRENYLLQLNQSNKFYEMIFKTVNKNQQAVAGIPFSINANNNIINLASDQNGLIKLPNIFEGTEITAKQISKDIETNEIIFIFNTAIAEYLLPVVIAEPVIIPPTPIKFLILDKFGTIIPNAKITITAAIGKITKITDSNGTALFEELSNISEFKVYASSGKYYAKEQFSNIPKDKIIVIALKKKKWTLWWLWLLLLILLIIAAFFIYKYLTKPAIKKTIPAVVKPIEKPKNNDAILDCSKPIDVAAGDNRGSEKRINLVQKTGVFKLWYEMYDAPDKLIIYNSEKPSEIVYQTRNTIDGTGYVSGQNEVIVKHYCSNITIKVYAQTSNTKWKYKISCVK